MPLVIIQTSPLSGAAKKRIGDRVIESFHSEGIPATSVVILFQPDTSDIYLDGGMVHELDVAPVVSSRPVFEPAPIRVHDFRAPEDVQKSKARRNRQELGDLRKSLIAALEDQGALSSFEAQEELGLRDCDWAPATLRRIFGELKEEGLIVQQGQKRGTRYVWAGLSSNPTATPMAKLVKRTFDHDTLSAEDQEPE